MDQGLGETQKPPFRARRGPIIAGIRPLSEYYSPPATQSGRGCHGGFRLLPPFRPIWYNGREAGRVASRASGAPLGRIAVIIPAKNEAENISGVLSGIRAHLPEADIIVVDDNSDDATAETVLLCESATLLHCPVSVGIGGAVQLGVRYALERGYPLFIRMDGDGQHPPQAARELVRNHLPGLLVQGSRDPHQFSTTSNSARKIGSLYFRSLFRLFTGSQVTDPTSGFMCFDREMAEMFARFYPMDFPEIESLVLLARSGHKIVPVTVSMTPRISGVSSIGWFRAGVYMFSVSIAFFSSFVRKNPYGAAHAA
ncbi:MAG: glycosyl transferase family 2 [Fibrobacteres bacterium]|nr:glycosyl transferase family 2 [Fibrobacterota bacterium]